MNKFVCFAVGTALALALAGCSNKETTEALQKATDLENQKQYRDANNVLVDALQARQAKLRADAGMPADQATPDPAADDALEKKTRSDSEMLKLERAQIPLYLLMERPDMASAVYSFILAGSPTDSVVNDFLHDKDPHLRIGAARILGLAGKPDGIGTLTETLKDSDQDVRAAAATALGLIKDPKTVDPLIGALKDSYWFVRSEAANALAQEHDGRAVKPLIDAVGDSDNTVVTSAETALLQLSQGTKPAASPDDFAARLNDSNPKIVLLSAVCLAVLKDARTIPTLQKLLSSSDETTRLDAVKGLGQVGDSSVIPTLRELLKSTDVNMRGWSIIGLGNLKDQGSLPDLQAIAADPAQPAPIKTAAQAAIKHISASSTDSAPSNSPASSNP